MQGQKLLTKRWGKILMKRKNIQGKDWETRTKEKEAKD